MGSGGSKRGLRIVLGTPEQLVEQPLTPGDSVVGRVALFSDKDLKTKGKLEICVKGITKVRFPLKPDDSKRLHGEHLMFTTPVASLEVSSLAGEQNRVPAGQYEVHFILPVPQMVPPTTHFKQDGKPASEFSIRYYIEASLECVKQPSIKQTVEIRIGAPSRVAYELVPAMKRAQHVVKTLGIKRGTIDLEVTLLRTVFAIGDRVEASCVLHNESKASVKKATIKILRRITFKHSKGTGIRETSFASATTKLAGKFESPGNVTLTTQALGSFLTGLPTIQSAMIDVVYMVAVSIGKDKVHVEIPIAIVHSMGAAPAGAARPPPPSGPAPAGPAGGGGDSGQLQGPQPFYPDLQAGGGPAFAFQQPQFVPQHSQMFLPGPVPVQHQQQQPMQPHPQFLQAQPQYGSYPALAAAGAAALPSGQYPEMQRSGQYPALRSGQFAPAPLTYHSAADAPALEGAAGYAQAPPMMGQQQMPQSSAIEYDRGMASFPVLGQEGPQIEGEGEGRVAGVTGAPAAAAAAPQQQPQYQQQASAESVGLTAEQIHSALPAPPSAMPGRSLAFVTLGAPSAPPEEDEGQEGVVAPPDWKPAVVQARAVSSSSSRAVAYA